jgi:hypothetical protein
MRFLLRRPPLNHAHSLPDRQPNPWPMLDRLLEYPSRFVEIVAGVEHAIDLAAVLGPLLDLVEVRRSASTALSVSSSDQSGTSPNLSSSSQPHARRGTASAAV